MKPIRYLIIILSFNVYADEKEQIYGDWRAGIISSDSIVFAYANTTNESESTLGILCLNDSVTCVPYLLNGLRCEEGGEYPILVAIDDGVVSVDAGCLHIEDRHLFTLPDDHIEYMATMNRYSVAYGTETGKFIAAYFSLNGSAKAQIVAKKLIDSASKSSDENKNLKYEDVLL